MWNFYDYPLIFRTQFIYCILLPHTCAVGALFNFVHLPHAKFFFICPQGGKVSAIFMDGCLSHLFRIFFALQYFMTNVWHVKCRLVVISADTLLSVDNGNYDYFNIFLALCLGSSLSCILFTFFINY